MSDDRSPAAEAPDREDTEAAAASGAPHASAPAAGPAPGPSVEAATEPSAPPGGEAESDEAPVASGEESVDGEVVAGDDLEARAAKAEEYLALAQRTRADFENFRRRAARDAALAQERGVMKLARELLPAVDNLDRALAHTESAAAEATDPSHENLLAGVRLVHADLLGALARVGIEPFSPDGEPFDPQHHEAMAQAPVEGATSGTVVEVYQRGYRLGETVLRPARVVVAA